MKKSMCVLIFCLFLASAGYAQQNAADLPASKADVQQLLDAMHTRDMMTQMMTAMKQQERQMIHQQLANQNNLPPDFEAKTDKIIDDVVGNMPLDDILQAMIPVYQKHFTKGDMDALIAFYSSPTGQKMVKEMPAITTESMQASAGIVQKMMAQTRQRIQDQVNQMQKQSSGTVKNN